MKNSVNRTLDSSCLFKVKFPTLNVSLNSWKSALTNFIRMQISFCKMCILHTDANYVRWPHKLEQPIYGSVQNWDKVFLFVINHLCFTNQNPSFIRWYWKYYLEFISKMKMKTQMKLCVRPIASTLLPWKQPNCNVSVRAIQEFTWEFLPYIWNVLHCSSCAYSQVDFE